MSELTPQKSWQDSLSAFTQPEVMRMLFLGFSAGLPILLIFSSLGLWLREAGIERSAVTYFSWAALGYSFKFVWAPLVDNLPLPLLNQRLGRRRSWLLLAQLGIAAAILGMAFSNPEQSLTMMAVSAVLLGFTSATQDIVIDAYRIESADSDLQALLSSTYIAGYRIGMLVAGAGALYLASFFGSSANSYSYSAWQITYVIMSACMAVGVITTLLIPEPESNRSSEQSLADSLRFFVLFLLAIAGFIASFVFSSDLTSQAKQSLQELTANKALASLVVESLRLGLSALLAGFIAYAGTAMGIVKKTVVDQTYIAPVRDFFQRYGTQVALLLLALIGLYRISDIVLGVISNIFYQDLGFSKTQIATVVKTFGLFMTLLGGFVGGLLSMRYGVMRILWLGAILSAVTNLLFMLLANVGDELWLLYVVISADNLAAGIASAAFIAFLSSLTNINFTAMQYAIFSSLMTLIPKVLGGYSGSIVDSIGYSQFFIITTLIGLPVLWLIHLADQHLSTNDDA